MSTVSNVAGDCHNTAERSAPDFMATAVYPFVSTEPTTACQFPWFALRVRARSERVAVNALRDKDYEPFAPTYQTRRVYNDRVKTVEYPVFPGYVFCRFDPAEKFTILNSPAVSYIVGFGGRMMAVPDEDIDAVRRAVAAGASPVPYLTAGQRVRIERGPLLGLTGVLLRSDGNARIVISIEMLQRSIAVNIAMEDVMLVTAPKRG